MKKDMSYNDFTKDTNPKICLNIDTGKRFMAGTEEIYSIKPVPKDWTGSVLDAMRYPSLRPFDAIWITVVEGRLSKDEIKLIIKRMIDSYKEVYPLQTDFYKACEQIFANKKTSYKPTTNIQQACMLALSGDVWSYKTALGLIRNMNLISEEAMYTIVTGVLEELNQ
jgi:hypothetical protein